MIFAFMPAGISSTFGGFHPEGISSAKRISLQLRKCAVARCAKTLRRTRRWGCLFFQKLICCSSGHNIATLVIGMANVPAHPFKTDLMRAAQ